ncbi:hypothetical protein F5X99DRAFT_26313 [Biscogniauxia marginata]|nr:hypothetical protein F5X99DRAFT_26313 [Biscogniauxia marginata]
MAPQTSKTSAEPTFYEILALTPQHLEGQAAPAQQKVVKQAYHRALLRHHPDKKISPISPSSSSSSSASASASTSKPNPSPSSSPSSQSKSKSKSKSSDSSSSSSKNGGIIFTVDQIQQAYGVLSDRKQRAEYDQSLRHQRVAAASPSSSFRTGVETVDLDDLGFDERTGVYHRGCRCGNARGYAFTEEDLDEFEDDGVLMVECLDCSLWLRVLFAPAADDDDDDDDEEGESAVVDNEPVNHRQQGGGGGGGGGGEARISIGVPEGTTGIEVRRRGSSAGSGEGKGWKFNWSFNWGISVSGSAVAATARTGTER